MSVRRFLTSLGLVLVTAACAENLSSPAPLEQAPHFLKWTATTRPEFAFEGADRSAPASPSSAPRRRPWWTRSSSATASTASLSWSHTVGSGANRLLVVGVSHPQRGQDGHQGDLWWASR